MSVNDVVANESARASACCYESSGQTGVGSGCTRILSLLQVSNLATSWIKMTPVHTMGGQGRVLPTSPHVSLKTRQARPRRQSPKPLTILLTNVILTIAKQLHSQVVEQEPAGANQDE
jgi:hypothetical protein